MEACNVSGVGTVRAKGGDSIRGSGAGGGGRIAIAAGFVSPSLSMMAPGGTSDSPEFAAAGMMTCGGSCGCSIPFWGASGSISDGSGSYSNGENCWWLIDSGDDRDISVSFQSFSTESYHDQVRIYECDTQACSSPRQILSHSGSSRPTGVYTSATGVLKVTFTSDGSSTSSGFTATWTVGNNPSSGDACSGAAGSVYVLNGTSTSLVLDNSDRSSALTTRTPFPLDLSGVHLSQLNISGKAYVDLRETARNNDVRAQWLDLDEDSIITGDKVIIDTSNATIRGRITGTLAVWLHNTRSGAGTVTAFSGSVMTCSSCMLQMSLTGSVVVLQGSISATNTEIKGLRKLSHTGSMHTSGSQMVILSEAATIHGTVTCSGAGCSSLMSVNETLELGGSLSCTSGECRMSLRSGGDMISTGNTFCSGTSGQSILSMSSGGGMISTGTVSCSGNNQCLVDVASQESATFEGSISGSDIRMIVAASLQLKGIISSSGQGYAEESGPGAGNTPTYSGGSSNTYATSGGGGGHGGDGAATCWNFRSTSESPTGMTVYRRGIDL